MKLKLILTYFLLLPAFLVSMQGCNQCDVTGGVITFTPEDQFIQITYLVDSSGVNYCQQIYNPNNVRVMFNDNGGFGQYVPLAENLSDGVIGPFNYTVSPTLAKKGEFNHYRYIITKDTFGIDTVDVKFYPAVDECQEFWSLVEFYLNGVLLPNEANLTICDLEVRE